MQVVVDDQDLREFQRASRRDGMTLAEWVRQTLRRAVRETPRADVARRLAVIRAAAQHEFPTADVDQMLAEVERGYGS
jgi:hypothetical protein